MNPRQPQGAFRSSSFLHMNEEVNTALNEELKQQHTEETEDLRALKQIASLDSHPGWHLIRDQFAQTIEEYRSGRKLADFCRDYTLTDAQIGQATRNMNLIADELTSYLNSVALSVQELERIQKEQQNAAQQQPRVAGRA